MSDVTRILSRIEQGDGHAAEELLPLVYDELRRLAAARMAQESPDRTLQSTALVHEAYIRLVDVEKTQHWDSRGHFFSAAAEAMRRILVENARLRKSQKRGGDLCRVELDSGIHAANDSPEEVLDVDDALSRLAADEPEAAELVKLRFFAGLSLADAAKHLEIPRSSAYEQWAYARARIRCLIGCGE